YPTPEEPISRFKTSLCRIDYAGMPVALRSYINSARRNGTGSSKEKTSMTSFAKNAKNTAAAIFATTVLTFSLSAALAARMPSPPALAFQSAKSLYASKCAVCHGNDGSANTAKGKELKVRNLRSEEFKKMSDAKAMEVMLKGK